MHALAVNPSGSLLSSHRRRVSRESALCLENGCEPWNARNDSTSPVPHHSGCANPSPRRAVSGRHLLLANLSEREAALPTMCSIALYMCVCFRDSYRPTWPEVLKVAWIQVLLLYTRIEMAAVCRHGLQVRGETEPCCSHVDLMQVLLRLGDRLDLHIHPHRVCDQDQGACG